MKKIIILIVTLVIVSEVFAGLPSMSGLAGKMEDSSEGLVDVLKWINYFVIAIGLVLTAWAYATNQQDARKYALGAGIAIFISVLFTAVFT
jgi:hypothetical protein